MPVDAEVLEAEEWERVKAADEAMARTDLEQRLEVVSQGVLFSKPRCLVSFVGVERVFGRSFLGDW